jgi:hypothetical protein
MSYARCVSYLDKTDRRAYSRQLVLSSLSYCAVDLDPGFYRHGCFVDTKHAFFVTLRASWPLIPYEHAVGFALTLHSQMRLVLFASCPFTLSRTEQGCHLKKVLAPRLGNMRAHT